MVNTVQWTVSFPFSSRKKARQSVQSTLAWLFAILSVYVSLPDWRAVDVRETWRALQESEVPINQYFVVSSTSALVSELHVQLDL